MTTLYYRSGLEFKGTPRTYENGAHYTIEARRCNRCGGAGGSDRWAHTGWTCFECGGSGRGRPREVKLYTADRIAKLDATKAKNDARRAEQAAAKRAVEEAEAAARRDEFLASLPAAVRAIVVLDRAECLKLHGETVADIARRGYAHASLSPAQIAVLERAADRAAARAERAAQDAASVHIGQVGERRDFILSVGKVLRFDSPGFPRITTFINLCRDQDGNAVVYKGSNGWYVGEKILVKATVKEHGERNGVKQTVIARPKVIEAIELTSAT